MESVELPELETSSEPREPVELSKEVCPEELELVDGGSQTHVHPTGHSELRSF